MTTPADRGQLQAALHASSDAISAPPRRAVAGAVQHRAGAALGGGARAAGECKTRTSHSEARIVRGTGYDVDHLDLQAALDERERSRLREPRAVNVSLSAHKVERR